MNVGEIFDYIKSISEQDTSIQEADLYRWVDDGINRINQELHCDIPTVSGKGLDYEPEFDKRYHEVLVNFGAAKYRESDADFNSAIYFMNIFNDTLMAMQRDMMIKPSQRRDFNVQQISVVNPNEISYALNIPSGSYFDKIVVYKNDEQVNSVYYAISNVSQTITFKIPLVSGDKITVVFENNSDLNNPPYEWWSAW